MAQPLSGTTVPAIEGEAQNGLNDVFVCDPYPAVAILQSIRQRHVQALHAGLSRRDWYATETAANQLRDEIDRLIIRLGAELAASRAANTERALEAETLKAALVAAKTENMELEAERNDAQKEYTSMMWQRRRADEREEAAEAALAASKAGVERLREALKPFAAIEPSSLYPRDGSEGERYAVFLSADARDKGFTGADLARARAALEASRSEGEP